MALHNSWRTGHNKIARDAINNIKKNLAKRPSFLPELPKDPLKWIEKARPIVEGKKRTFQTVPFWREIYLDEHPSKMIIGGRQIYKSTYITNILACEATSTPGVQVGYVTYDQYNLTGFSKQKLQIGTFGQNSILSKFPRNKLGNIGEISLKNGSTIYCMTDNNQYQHVEGKSLNHCILDESQYQDIEHLEKVRQTMMATKGKLSVLGVGGVSGSAYEKLWKKTDQREWIYDDVDWREKLQFDEKGLVIGKYLNYVLSGKWIATQPENTLYHGYHLPQTIFATIPLTISDAISKYKISPVYSIEYLKKENSASYFQSHTMGKFYRSEQRPITPEMVYSCMNPYRYLGLFSPSEIAMWKDTMKNRINISMGVDFGSGNSSDTVVSIIIHWKKSDRLQLAYLDKRPSENQMDQAEFICKLFQECNCDVGVGDLGYGAIQVKTIQDGGANRLSGELFPGVGDEKFFGCRTISNESKPMQIHLDTVDEHGEENGRISIDKTTQIQRFIDLLETKISHPGNDDSRRSKLMIPFDYSKEYETDWLVPEFTSLTRKDFRKKDIDPRQNAKKEFNHPPDSMMSIIYARVGLEQDTGWFYVSA